MSQKLFCDPVAVFLDLIAYNHSLKGPQKPKTYCKNSISRSYLSPSVFIVRLLGQDPCEKSPATTPANYAPYELLLEQGRGGEPKQPKDQHVGGRETARVARGLPSKGLGVKNSVPCLDAQ